MFDIGFLELFVIATLALIVLGPERLPGAARSVGLMFGKVRRTINGIQEDLERQVRLEELQKKLKDPQAIFEQQDFSGNEYSAQEEAEQDLQDALLSPSDKQLQQDPLLTPEPINKPAQPDTQKIDIQPAKPTPDE